MSDRGCTDEGASCLLPLAFSISLHSRPPQPNGKYRMLNNRVRRYKLRQMMMPDSEGGGRMLETRGSVLQRVEGIDELIPEEL
jgi:hypothetical protein